MSWCQFSESPCKYGIPDNDSEEKFGIFIFYFIFGFFGTRRVDCTKKKKTYSEFPFFPYFGTFWYVLTCCALVLVLQNFEMLQLLTFPKKLPYLYIFLSIDCGNGIPWDIQETWPISPRKCMSKTKISFFLYQHILGIPEKFCYVDVIWLFWYTNTNSIWKSLKLLISKIMVDKALYKRSGSMKLYNKLYFALSLRYCNKCSCVQSHQLWVGKWWYHSCEYTPSQMGQIFWQQESLWLSCHDSGFDVQQSNHYWYTVDCFSKYFLTNALLL